MQFLNHQVLAPGAEASLDYELAFPRQLPTQQFVLKMTLVVAVRDSSSGRDGWLPNLFFNETITMVEGKTWVDTELLGLLVIFLGVLGLGGGGGGEGHAGAWQRREGWRPRAACVCVIACAPCTPTRSVRRGRGGEEQGVDLQEVAKVCGQA